VYGTFENGRVEEYFDSNPLTAADLRDPQISSWIGARMAELHQVDIDAVELHDSSTSSSASPHTSPGGQNQYTWSREVEKNVKSWLVSAREVLALPAVSDETRTAFALDQFEDEWIRYMSWLKEWESRHGTSPVVFAHNDAQYGNLLRLNKFVPGSHEHQQVRFRFGLLGFQIH
jgi:choline kinase